MRAFQNGDFLVKKTSEPKSNTISIYLNTYNFGSIFGADGSVDKNEVAFNRERQGKYVLGKSGLLGKRNGFIG